MFTRGISKRVEIPRTQLRREATATIPDTTSEDEKDRIARRRANAIVLLGGLGDDQLLWPAFKYFPDPRLRSYLIDHLRHTSVVPDSLMAHISDADPGTRQAVILILGSSLAAPTSSVGQNFLVESLLQIFRNDPDSGVHSAAEWSLRRLAATEKVEQALGDLSQLGIRQGYEWYVTKSRITMIIFEQPGLLRLGSPESEPARDTTDEAAWTFDLKWSFAISATEVTQAQYQAICPDYKKYLNEHAPLPNCPANTVTWLDAVQFCRLLSERDGLPDSEMVVPPVADLRKGPYFNVLDRMAYRLPLEVEWEVRLSLWHAYAAFFWLLRQIYFRNTPATLATRAVNRGPLHAVCPTTLGCSACWATYQSGATTSGWSNQNHGVRKSPDASGFATLANYAVRGNDYVSDAHMLRCANRRLGHWSENSYSRGFRIAHTIRGSRQKD